MRLALAAALSLLVLVTAVSPHVHSLARGTEDCAVCVVRGAVPADAGAPDVAPRAVLDGPVQPTPALAAVTGAPLGAIPGQSPPRA